MIFRIPDEKNTLVVFGGTSDRKFSKPRFRVLVWNVWKGKRGERWAQDFRALSADRNLVLLQEAIQAPQMSDLFSALNGVFEWHMAISFSWGRSNTTGVITGASVQPQDRRFLRGTRRELFVWTPKITLGTFYEIEGAGSLLVINTHVVNFTTTRAFAHFIEELATMIESHKGPVLLAGDFNTWNIRRWLMLESLLKELNFEGIDFQADPRLLKLDHVFVRGLKILEAQVRDDIQSSDHFPILAEFEVVK